jgi:hypothetical protein
MIGTTDRTIPRSSVDGYLARIEAHRVRLADGHDPMGHLFAIERLARAARADWWALEHPREAGRAKA